MSVVRAPNILCSPIFAVLLPILPQLLKKKKPNPNHQENPKPPAVWDGIYPKSRFCKSICCYAHVPTMESSGILRNAAKQVREKCKVKLIQRGRKIERSGNTYPTLLLSLESFPGQWSRQLRRKLQDTNSLSSFSDNINALHFQCSVQHCNEYIHIAFGSWKLIWIHTLTANYYKKAKPKLTVPNWKAQIL